MWPMRTKDSIKLMAVVGGMTSSAPPVKAASPSNRIGNDIAIDTSHVPHTMAGTTFRV